MSEPYVKCLRCTLKRSCMKHILDSNPVEEAKEWLKERCPVNKTCQFEYRVGIYDSSLIRRAE